MKFTEQKRYELIRRLDAAYSVGGREALAKMTSVEVSFLHAEKMVDRRTAEEQVKQHPNDELARTRYEKAEREASDIAGFLRNAEKNRDLDME